MNVIYVVDVAGYIKFEIFIDELHDFVEWNDQEERVSGKKWLTVLVLVFFNTFASLQDYD